MSPIEPYEAYVENYLLLIKDKHTGNFIRLLELKGIKKPEQGSLLAMLQKRIPYHDDLSENPKLFPSESTVAQSNMTPTSIATSLSTMASTAASNVSSPTEGTRGKLNENFRKLVMTGMAFRKDLQEKRDQH